MKSVFKVRDFMKIESADIDISNFTIFVGTNNSGKTKLMELIYGVLKSIDESSPVTTFRFINNRMQFHEKQMASLLESTNEYLRTNKDRIVQSIFNKDISIGNFEIDITDYDYWYEAVLLTENDMSVVSELEKTLPLDRVNRLRDFRNNQIKKRVVIITRDIHNDEIKDTRSANFFTDIPNGSIRDIITKVILKNILSLDGFGASSMLFLPASRMGLAMLYKEFFSSFSLQPGSMELGEGSSKRNQYFQSDHITKPVLDFLRFELGYSYNLVMAKRNQKLVEFVNSNLLNGSLNEKGDMAMYSPLGSSIEIPLFLSSSMINELDPIIKMLTDRKSYDFVFYDEVETSLHPLKQIELVKLLNRLNNSGKRFLISTHSDTFVTKFNNLLLISRSGKMKGDSIKLLDGKVEITPDDLLNSNEVHIYQFANKAKGKSEIKELKFQTTPMIGYSFELFEDSSSALYEEAKVALGIE